MLEGNKIGVVVPAYNEERLIGRTLSSIPEYVDRIFVVNDGSTDETGDIIENHAENGRITYIDHHENRGVGAAIVSGYKKCLEHECDIAVVMAGDNQMDPEYIPHLLKPIINGEAHYTKGNRLISPEYRRGMSKWRFTGNALLTFLTKLASGYWQIMDPQNGYTAISAGALKTLDLDKIYTYYGYCNDILVKLNVYGFKVLDVNIPARYGDEKSKIRYINYILKVSSMLLANFFWRLKMKHLILSFNPVIFFYIFGIIITPISMIFGAYSLYYKFILGKDLFIRLALSMLLFIVGIQFIMFAMLYDMQTERR
jgi:glycosyltransferase involved in cell wall biosynthesis